jgi:hypothetical protein
MQEDRHRLLRFKIFMCRPHCSGQPTPSSAILGRLPLELRFQTLHLVFEAQLQFLQPHFL